MEQTIGNVPYVAPQTLLIVDDDAINRGILDNIFSAYYKVEEAEDGRVGLEKITAAPENYCAVLLDVMMPEMDGLEATRCIRAMDRPDAKTVPIIAMTANAFSDDIQRSREAGVNEHLSKPLDLPLLLQAIHRCLHQ